MTSAYVDPYRPAQILAALRGIPNQPEVFTRTLLQKADFTGLPGIVARDEFVKRACGVAATATVGPISQALVIGGGYLRRSGNPHEVLRAINHSARCVYVDDDPQVVADVRGRLRGPGLAAVHAKARAVRPMVEDVGETLDLERPVFVIYPTDLVPSDEAEHVMSGLRTHLPRFSRIVVINSGRGLTRFAESWKDLMGHEWFPRSADWIRTLARTSGVTVMLPGVADCARYRGESSSPASGFLFAITKITQKGEDLGWAPI